MFHLSLLAVPTKTEMMQACTVYYHGIVETSSDCKNERLTRPEMVAINVIARAVPGSWPLYTKNEVQARAPRPQDRTSYFCNHTIQGQTLGLPVALLLQQQRIVNFSKATLRREVAIASHRPADANMWVVFTCYAT